VIDVLVDAGFPVKVCCRKLGVSSPGYYRYRQRPLAPTKMRREWLTSLIREVHLQSRGTYGYRRVHAELTKGMGLEVSDRLVWFLMHEAGIRGLPNLTGKKPTRGIPTADDLVNRRFHRDRPNELWMTDITEHPTREGKVFCCCVLDAFPRRIIGWSIDSVQNSNLVVADSDGYAEFVIMPRSVSKIGK
jgi:transposase InsO family protein